MKLETIEYLAGVLNIQLGHAYSLIRNGIIGPPVVVHVGRQVRVNPQELEIWISNGGNGYPGGWKREASQEVA